MVQLAKNRVVTETKAIQNLFDRLNILQAVYKYNFSQEEEEPIYTYVPLQNIIVADDGDDRDGHNLIQVAFESLDSSTKYVDDADFELWSSYMDLLEQQGDAVTSGVEIKDEYKRVISSTFKGSITTIAKVTIEDFVIAGVPFCELSIGDYNGNFINVLASNKVKKPMINSFVKSSRDNSDDADDAEVVLNKASRQRVFTLLKEHLWSFPYIAEITTGNITAKYTGSLTFEDNLIKADDIEIKLTDLDKADSSVISWGDNSLCLVWNKQTRNQTSIEIYFRPEYFSQKLVEEFA